MKTHRMTHLAFAAALGLTLMAASDKALAQNTSPTADQRSTATTPKSGNAAAAKPAKRWDGAQLKPVDERAPAKPAATPDAVRTAPANADAATTGTGCRHAKADDA